MSAIDKLLWALAQMLPRRLVLWVYVRVVAHATTGQFSDTVVPELTTVDAAKRWVQK